MMMAEDEDARFCFCWKRCFCLRIPADASSTLREEKVNEMQVMLDALVNSDPIVIIDYKTR